MNYDSGCVLHVYEVLIFPFVLSLPSQFHCVLQVKSTFLQSHNMEWDYGEMVEVKIPLGKL